MKKFTAFMVMTTSLFIIGMIGLIYFYLFTSKPLDNYFAFIIILAIATLPRTFLEFFMISKNMDKHTLGGFLRFFLYFINFSLISDWISSSHTYFLLIIRFCILLIFFFWGRSYYRNHSIDEKNSLIKTDK